MGPDHHHPGSMRARLAGLGTRQLIISTCVRRLGSHELEQRVVVVDDVVPHAAAVSLAAQRRKEFAGALDLRYLHALELEGGHRALGLGDEVDVLDLRGVVAEGDGPVGVVVADRGRDEEPSRQLGVDDDLVADVELLDE